MVSSIAITVFLPRIIDNFSPVFSPFEDLEVFKYALSLPPEALRGQAAYQRILDRHYPKLAKFSNESPESKPYVGKRPTLTRLYQHAVSKLPSRLSRRLDYWSTPGWSIDPNADLMRGSAAYLRGLLQYHTRWDLMLDRKGVANLIEDHLADRRKAGFQVQALVTLIEAMDFCSAGLSK